MDYDAFEDGFSYTSLGAIHFKHHPGSGEKMIFLHGLGGTTRAWKRLMEHMPEDLDIYLIDLLGHGESDAPEIDYTVSAQFQVLREFISLNNNGDSYIVGHSYGGWVAAYYATQPYTCKGLVLEDIAGLKDEHDEVRASGQAEAMVDKAMRTAMGEGNKEYVIKGILSAFYTETEEQLTTQSLSKIKSRALIIWGAQDSVFPVKYGKALQGKIKDASLVVIENADHDVNYEQPEAVARAILDFIGHARA